MSLLDSNEVAPSEPVVSSLPPQAAIPPKPGVYQSSEVIPKKAAAQEVYNLHKRSRIASLIAIFSVVLIASIGPLTRSTLGIYVSAGVAGIISMGLALFVWKDSQRMAYLQQTYGLIGKVVK